MMEFHRVWLSSALVVLVSGCAGSPVAVSMMEDREYEQLVKGRPDLIICKHYSESYARKPIVREILESKGLVPDDEWEYIDQKKIIIGMSRCGLYASWGAPKRENEYVSASGVRIQYIYGSLTGNYVYTNDGKITSWSKHE